jgi:hypothetical protein
MSIPSVVSIAGIPAPKSIGKDGTAVVGVAMAEAPSASANSVISGALKASPPEI